MRETHTLPVVVPRISLTFSALFLSINREFNNITEQKQRPGLGIMSFFTGVGRRWGGGGECPPHKGVRRGKRKLTVFGK